MKSLLITLAICYCSILHSQSVGIHTTSPDSTAALEIASSSKGLLIPRMNSSQRNGINNPANGLLVYDLETASFWYFQNTIWYELNGGAFEENNGVIRNVGNESNDFIFGFDSLPVNGNDYTESMFFFDKSKSAFRVGNVFISQNWNPQHIGTSSIGIGTNTKAEGNNSISIGRENEALGASSLALGRFTTATGNFSTSLGDGTEARGEQSTALGVSTNANGNRSLAAGFSTYADAYLSTAIGKYNIGGGDSSNWVLTDPLFEIGIGENLGARENALTVLKDGTLKLKSYEFPNEDGNDGDVLVTDGMGHLTWQSLGGGIACPNDMLPFNATTCIDTLANPAATYSAALNDCHSKGERLPHFDEFYNATNELSLPPSSNWNWMRDIFLNTQNLSTKYAYITRTNNLLNFSYGSITSNYEYRCVYDR